MLLDTGSPMHCLDLPSGTPEKLVKLSDRPFLWVEQSQHLSLWYLASRNYIGNNVPPCQTNMQHRLQHPNWGVVGLVLWSARRQCHQEYLRGMHRARSFQERQVSCWEWPHPSVASESSNHICSTSYPVHVLRRKRKCPSVVAERGNRAL